MICKLKGRFMKLKNIFAITISLILVFILCGCTASNERNIRNDKPVIAVSIVPEATFVQKVCGDKFRIIAMIPSGASPETYEPSPKESANLENAEIYFSIGVPAEESILKSVPESAKTVALHTAVSKKYPDLTDNEHGGRDPHIWLSPKRVTVMITTIADTLSLIDPDNADLYRSNADSYIKELKNLNNEINELFKAKQNRNFIMFHPSFGYFADDYGLSMYSLEEHGKEASAQRIAEIADLAKKENISFIFYQAESTGRQAQAFAEEIGGKAVALEPLSADYINNLRKTAQKLCEAMN